MYCCNVLDNGKKNLYVFFRPLLNISRILPWAIKQNMLSGHFSPFSDGKFSVYPADAFGSPTSTIRRL